MKVWKKKNTEIGEKYEEVSVLVQRAVEETLSSPNLHAMLTDIIVEKTVPKLIEGFTMAGISTDQPLPSEEASREVQLIDDRPAESLTPFTLVRNKKSKRKAKKTGNDRTEKRDGNQKTELSGERKHLTLAEIVKSLPLKPDQAPKPTYITISGAGQNPVDIINGLPSPAQIGVKAEIVRATKGGSVLVRLDDSSHVTKVIGWQELRDKGLQAKLALRKKPRLEVIGVPHGWDSAELVRFLWGKIAEKSAPTQLVKDDLRPLFSSVARNGFSKNWVVEVHPMVRFMLLEMGSLKGGWWSMTFKDYLDAPRCTKCQGYGHTKATCKVETIVCIWCGASGHVLKECPRKKDSAGPNCINCVRANAPLNKRNHKSGSRECPVHLKWAKDIVKSTFYE